MVLILKPVRAAGLVALAVVVTAGAAFAQESGIHLRSVRVLAADPEAVATFYEKAFGMSETRRLGSGNFKEIVINSGSTPELARAASTTGLVIATKPKGAVAPAMAAVILHVDDIDAALAAVKAAGGTQVRPPGKSPEGLSYVFVKDPDGNQIELLQPK